MDIYSFGLLLGGAGLGAMAIAGLAGGIRGHAGSHARGADATHVGHAGHTHAGAGHSATGAHAAHGHATHAHSAAGHAHGVHSGDVSRMLLTLVSPRVAFSALVGFGATGLLLHRLLGEPFTLVAAIAGGIAFERFAVAPMWRFFSRFESGPAQTLESVVTDEARAVTHFDAAGEGLVAIELDGQIVQLLGVLAAPERGSGLTVRAGDRLRVEAVDGVRNRCTVSLLGA